MNTEQVGKEEFFNLFPSCRHRNRVQEDANEGVDEEVNQELPTVGLAMFMDTSPVPPVRGRKRKA